VLQNNREENSLMKGGEKATRDAVREIIEDRLQLMKMS